MAKVGAQRAAELTGKSKSTIQRSMNSGTLSFDLDSNGRRMIDVSELERVFGLNQNATSAGGNSAPALGGSVAEAELEKASHLLDIERLKMRVKMLEDKLHMTEEQLDDLRAQRDQWQKQAAQMLITSQYSQKQAEDMREELKDRERKTKERRAQIEEKTRQRRELEQKMSQMQAQNQNASAPKSSEQPFNFKGLWKKVRQA
jgi:chromosome segregation ATPase